MERLLTTSELAALLGKSPRSIEKERVAGRGVPFCKLGRSVRYELREVQAYLRRQRRTSTSDPGSEAP